MTPGHDHHHGGHGHGHPAARAGARAAPRLRLALALLLALFVVEAVGGLLTRSLALLSDAGHVLTDVVGLGLALAATSLADRAGTGAAGRTRGRTYGLYRLEILAALANAGLLVGIAGYVAVEAVRRIGDAPDVPGVTVLLIATGGLAVNLLAFALLRAGARSSLNLEGAYLEVLADTVGSVGVIGGGAVVAVTGWSWVDPVVGLAIAAWVLPRTWRLAAKALRILLEAAPAGVDLDRLAADLEALPGVVDVHDVHVWTLTSEMEAASAHLMVAAGTDQHGVLDQARAVLAEDHGLRHATLQVEPDDHTGCDEVSW